MQSKSISKYWCFWVLFCLYLTVHIDYSGGQEKTNPFFLCRKTHVAAWRWYCADYNLASSVTHGYSALTFYHLISSDIHSMLMSTCPPWWNPCAPLSWSVECSRAPQKPLWLPTRGGFSDPILNWVCTGRVQSPKRCTFRSQHTWKVQYSGVFLWAG